eukprot:TRINITY_DN2888_c0_g1_i1.p1 TRINITY_DN2888_c0_g1~~TRINITY_DN2888_c0_g1_i1.p1  ORF type:complete len:521 (+),score=212.44 TRINITY_DN2888_c0_g1_i1:44-1564(+)
MSRTDADILHEVEAGLVSSKLKRDTISNTYVVESTLGQGGFATVYLVTSKSTGKEYALKAIAKQEASANLEEVQAEVDVIEACNHPNIIGLHEIIETQANYCIVMELVTGGELFDQIASRRSFSEKDARDVTTQVITGLRYLHDNGFVHRDLKPENLLLSSPDDATIKIVDFGLSTKCSEPIFNRVGTSLYMAPEVVQSCDADSKGYDFGADLWSLGVITYVMVCGWAPFNAEEDSEIYELILSGEYQFPPEHYLKLSEECKSFISSFLLLDPTKRASLKDSLSHPWITAHASETDLEGTRDKIKAFQARKRLRGAVTAVKALNKMIRLGSRLGNKSANPTPANAETKPNSLSVPDATHAPSVPSAETKADHVKIDEKDGVKDLVGKFHSIILTQKSQKDTESAKSQPSEKATKLTCSGSKARMLGLTPSDVKLAVSHFQVWEKDGTVGSKEFFALVTDILKTQGKSPERALNMAKEFFKEADQDKNGTLDWEEFLEFYAEVMKYL